MVRGSITFLFVILFAGWAFKAQAASDIKSHQINQVECRAELQIIDDVLRTTGLEVIDSSFSCLQSPIVFQQSYGEEENYILVFIGIEMKTDDPQYMPFKTAWGTPAALYFSKKATVYRERIQAALSSGPSERDIAMCAICMSDKMLPSKQIAQMSDAILESNIWSTMKSCLGQGWTGAKNSIVDTAKSMLNPNLMVQAFSMASPASNSQFIIREAKKQQRIITATYKEIKKLIPQLIPSLRDLPSALSLDLACQFAGTTLTPILTSVVSRGMTKGTIGQAFTQFLFKLKGLVPLRGQIKRANQLIGAEKIKPFVNGVVSCGAR